MRGRTASGFPEWRSIVVKVNVPAAHRTHDLRVVVNPEMLVKAT